MCSRPCSVPSTGKVTVTTAPLPENVTEDQRRPDPLPACGAGSERRCGTRIAPHGLSLYHRGIVNLPNSDSRVNESRGNDPRANDSRVNDRLVSRSEEHTS